MIIQTLPYTCNFIFNPGENKNDNSLHKPNNNSNSHTYNRLHIYLLMIPEFNLNFSRAVSRLYNNWVLNCCRHTKFCVGTSKLSPNTEARAARVRTDIDRFIISPLMISIRVYTILSSVWNTCRDYNFNRFDLIRRVESNDSIIRRCSYSYDFRTDRLSELRGKSN